MQYIWVMNDATQRQQAEEALKDSHDPSHLLAELMPDAMMVIGETNTIAYINPAGLRLLGATAPEQLIGKPLTAIVPPDRQNAVPQRMEHLRGSADRRTRYEQHFLRLDKQPHPEVVTTMVSASPILWKGKASTLLSFSDPTAQQQTPSTTQKIGRAHV